MEHSNAAAAIGEHLRKDVLGWTESPEGKELVGERVALARAAPRYKSERDELLRLLKEMTFRAHLQPEDEWVDAEALKLIAECEEEQEPEAVAALLDRFRLIADAPRVRRERDALLEALVDVGLNFAEYVDGGGESRFKLPESVKTAIAACGEEADAEA